MGDCHVIQKPSYTCTLANIAGGGQDKPSDLKVNMIYAALMSGFSWLCHNPDANAASIELRHKACSKTN